MQLLKSGHWFVLAGQLMLMGAALWSQDVTLDISPAAIRRDTGHRYNVYLPELYGRLFETDSDSDQFPSRSHVMVLENGTPLYPSHSDHAFIADVGQGAYSAWYRSVYFSSLDNSDPTTSGRVYKVALSLHFRSEVQLALLLGSAALAGLAITMISWNTAAAVRRVAFGCGSLLALWWWIPEQEALVPRDRIIEFVAALCLWQFALWWRTRRRRAPPKPHTFVAAAATLSILLALAMCEAVLWVMERMPARSGVLNAVGQAVMPAELQRRDVNVPGSVVSYYWQGKLHVHDRDGFRRSTPLVPREDAVRIVVLGDSLTYGYGIDEKDAYATLLERRLDPRRPTQVLNLGASGMQSEDMVRIARRWLPMLRPHLVVYGICLNDFLPLNTGEYANNMRFALPIQNGLTTFIETRTRTGALLSNGYNSMLMAAGLRNDFTADILKDFGGYRVRFAADLDELNKVTVEATSRPVMAMVLDQWPNAPRHREIRQVAEEAATRAGMDLVPGEEAYRRFKGDHVQLFVNQWEGHPNEVAHAFFAEILGTRIEALPEFASDAARTVASPKVSR
jgi:lysophospholipase L1-like esterase